ncbi:MAG: hypothetical protein KKD77_22930 [Gammaproteobacteria bacterium]|nr:hypothetical protein [Gammaproteobacteria bacterium]
MEYITVNRNKNGKKTIAPFINGFNVWDIPKKEYTESVEKAIKHAFELGRLSMKDEMQDLLLGVHSRLDWTGKL